MKSKLLIPMTIMNKIALQDAVVGPEIANHETNPKGISRQRCIPIGSMMNRMNSFQRAASGGLIRGEDAGNQEGSTEGGVIQDSIMIDMGSHKDFMSIRVITRIIMNRKGSRVATMISAIIEETMMNDLINGEITQKDVAGQKSAPRGTVSHDQDQEKDMVNQKNPVANDRKHTAAENEVHRAVEVRVANLTDHEIAASAVAPSGTVRDRVPGAESGRTTLSEGRKVKAKRHHQSPRSPKIGMCSRREADLATNPGAAVVRGADPDRAIVQEVVRGVARIPAIVDRDHGQDAEAGRGAEVLPAVAIRAEVDHVQGHGRGQGVPGRDVRGHARDADDRVPTADRGIQATTNMAIWFSTRKTRNIRSTPRITKEVTMIRITTPEVGSEVAGADVSCGGRTEVDSAAVSVVDSVCAVWASTNTRACSNSWPCNANRCRK